MQFPSNLDTTFLSTAGVYVSTATTAAVSRTLQLFPFTGGYAVMAGKYVAPSQSSPGCISVDPEAWPETPTAKAAVRTPSTTTTAAALPMGLLTISGAAGKWVTAVSAAGTGTDDPGCSVPMTYTFEPSRPPENCVALRLMDPLHRIIKGCEDYGPCCQLHRRGGPQRSLVQRRGDARSAYGGDAMTALTAACRDRWRRLRPARSGG